ncbi:MAG: M28 family peptidase [Chloroflexi bacterium]|nr:M28 family peptidase [Chloroflexota bacterium]
MVSDPLSQSAKTHLITLCEKIPTRQLGSHGNQAAARYFADIMANNGFTVESQPFDCIDMRQGEIELSVGDEKFEALISLYSLGCDIRAELVQATTVDELNKLAVKDKLLLLSGKIAAEQLFPKNFVFNNPEHHQRIHQLLEEKQPAAVITATGRNPELAGGMYPFPMFEDGDFQFPAAFMKDIEGEKLAAFTGQIAYLKMDAERIASNAENISAQKSDQNGRIVVCAHIDAKAGTPGALDNAGGTTILMLLAELLKDYQGKRGIEILAINGEDNYSAGGEMEYLRRHQGDFGKVRLVINIDGVGFKGKPTGISFYECPEEIQDTALKVAADHAGIEEMPQWYQGDHMVFLSQGVPAIALTTASFKEVWADIAHTPQDTPEIVDVEKLVETAKFISRLIEII